MAFGEVSWKDYVTKEIIDVYVPAGTTNIPHRIGIGTKKVAPNIVVIVSAEYMDAINVMARDSDKITVVNDMEGAQRVKIYLERFISLESDVGTTSMNLAEEPPTVEYDDNLNNFYLYYKIGGSLVGGIK